MKIIAPNIPENLTEIDFLEVFNEEDPLVEASLIEGSIFINEFPGRIRLYHTVVRNCNFMNTDFTRMDLTDVRFENCDLSNTNLNKSSINRVEFNNCKLLGSNLTESYFGNVYFKESILDMAFFANSKF